MASRDHSNERPPSSSSVMATSMPRQQRKPPLSSQASEESTVSRISDSHIPDLESTHSQQSSFRPTYRDAIQCCSEIHVADFFTNFRIQGSPESLYMTGFFGPKKDLLAIKITS